MHFFYFRCGRFLPAEPTTESVVLFLLFYLICLPYGTIFSRVLNFANDKVQIFRVVLFSRMAEKSVIRVYLFSRIKGCV